MKPLPEIIKRIIIKNSHDNDAASNAFKLIHDAAEMCGLTAGVMWKCNDEGSTITAEALAEVWEKFDALMTAPVLEYRAVVVFCSKRKVSRDAIIAAVEGINTILPSSCYVRELTEHTGN